MRAGQTNLRDDPLVQQGDASMLRPRGSIAKESAPKDWIVQPPAKTAPKDIVTPLTVPTMAVPKFALPPSM